MPALPVSDFIYLASQSPRRAQLLRELGVTYRLLLPHEGSEDVEALEAKRPGELPIDYVQRVTCAKLDAAQARLARQGGASAPVLCADTTVALGDHILGKPLDATDAQHMLWALSGRTHWVFTAVIVAYGGQTRAALSRSKITMRPILAEEIDRYIAGGEPMGKAGSYAIQGLAAAWVERFEGSHSGVMGLPLRETAELLRSFQVPWALSGPVRKV